WSSSRTWKAGTSSSITRSPTGRGCFPRRWSAASTATSSRRRSWSASRGSNVRHASRTCRSLMRRPSLPRAAFARSSPTRSRFVTRKRLSGSCPLHRLAEGHRC
ncbi:MAG: hypothetical protein AVDCRST_MAG17-113, partial [uncultured Solirubrobacterales bacterium]